MWRSAKSGISSVAAGGPTEVRPGTRSRFALAAIWIAVTLAVLDGVIVNVALPSIAENIGVQASTSIWIINAYQLAIIVSLLPFAALGDALQYRRVYLFGLILFTAASAGCALATELSWLVAARVVQGIGAGAIMSMNGALVRLSVGDKKLGRVMGQNAVVIALAATGGPVLAGLVLTVANWPWLFTINIPLGIAAAIMAWRALPANVGDGLAFDWIATLMNIVTFGALLLGAEQLSLADRGLGFSLLAIGGGTGAALWMRSRHRKRPLVPVDLLRFPKFSLSLASSCTAFAAQMMALVALPFYFHGALQFGAGRIGLLMTAWPIGVGLAALIAGRLADRYPAGWLGGLGLTILAVGLFALSFINAQSTVVDILWRMSLCGFGFGVFQTPNNREIMLAVPSSRSGAAGGMLAMARLLGQISGAIAIAIAFHSGGTAESAPMLAAAAALAALAAGVSMTRLLVKPRIA